MKTMLALLLFISSSAHAEDIVPSYQPWSNTQLAELATFETLNLADWGTAHYCQERIYNCRGAYPLAGPHPTSTRLFAITALLGLGTYYIADVNPEYRDAILIFGIVVKADAVRNNIGVNGGFKLSFD